MRLRDNYYNIVHEIVLTIWYWKIVNSCLPNKESESGAIPVIKYLSLHYGSPLQIQKLAVATHIATGKITKPFEASNAAEMYSKIRRHLDAWNSLKSMATYMDREHGLQVSNAKLSQEASLLFILKFCTVFCLI